VRARGIHIDDNALVEPEIIDLTTTTIGRPSAQSLLLTPRFHGQALSTATGFIVRSRRGPLLITNRHVVTGRHQETNEPLSPTGGLPNELGIVHNHERGLGYWSERVEELITADGLPRWIEHPTLGSRADVVAIHLENLDGVAIYPVDLVQREPDISVGPADVVSVVGFPFGLRAGSGSYAIWATGFVASELGIDYEGLPLFLVDCRTREGQSGSPVIAYRSGAVPLTNGNTAILRGTATVFLGVYSGRINHASDLGRVWKVEAVRALVEIAGA
jgi:hypothetical protein